MKGLLLINLGTPDDPSVKSVRKYLRQFLSDPEVIDINPVLRFFLVQFIIAPFRSPKSSEAYQKIWTHEGSPLLVNSRNLTQKVQEKLGDEYVVALGMRYGKPSIETAINQILEKEIDHLTILPLYPQYSTSATLSSLHEVHRVLGKRKTWPEMQVLPAFYDHPGFIFAFAKKGEEVLQKVKPDHILFSFHGLPERHLKKLDETGAHCLNKPGCCEKITEVNQDCYRAQAYATARLIAEKLGIPKDQYTVCFQSRLGRTPWIKPYTDVLIEELGSKHLKNIVIFSPSFVADCLETLEEIGLRAKASFQEKGGGELTLVPSLNDSQAWVEAVCDMVKIPKTK